MRNIDTRVSGFPDKPSTDKNNAPTPRLTVALLDSLHLPDAVLVGHSMGGAIAAEVAIAHPERVRGLVLIGSAGGGGPGAPLFRRGRRPQRRAPLFRLRRRRGTPRLFCAPSADPN